MKTNKKILAISLFFIFIGIMGCTEQTKYAEGETKCVDFDLYTFVGNQWSLTERNCPECGYVPEHYEGETKCISFDLYTFVENQWMLTKRNCSECGYVPEHYEGETKCEGYDKWVYRNGLWVLVEEDSEDCGFIEPNENKEFLTFIRDTIEDTQYNAKKLSGYLTSGSMSLASYYSNELHEICSDALLEVYSYSVSEEYEEVQDEYYECLDDMSFGALYTHMGCKAMESKNYDLATTYFNSASEYTEKSGEHMDRVTYLINKIVGG